MKSKLNPNIELKLEILRDTLNEARKENIITKEEIINFTIEKINEIINLNNK